MATDSRPRKRAKTLKSLLPDAIHNFALLPVALPSPLPSTSPATHILYLRKHEEPPIPPALSTGPSRTLFVVNIPVDSTKELLRGLFASLGPRPEEIRINSGAENETEDSLPRTWARRLCETGASAHVTFTSPREVDLILKNVAKERQSGRAAREWGIGVEYPTASLGFARRPFR